MKKYPAEIRARLAYIDGMIRYQENPPPVTTMSGCVECGTPSRGGGLCPACLRDMKTRIMAKADEERRAKAREQRLLRETPSKSTMRRLKIQLDAKDPEQGTDDGAGQE